MSEHYCPTGKCECEWYCCERHELKIGEFAFAYYTHSCGVDDGEFDIRNMEHCPWPSRQKRVDGVPYAEDCVAQNETAYHAGRLAGAADMKAKIRRAVENVRTAPDNCTMIYRMIALDAIDKVEVGK